MSKHGENIRKRKDGRWEGRIKTSVYIEGKPKFHSIYGKSYSEVKEKMKSYQSNVISLENERKSCSNFSDILNQWLYTNRLRVKQSTIYKYEYLIEQHIAPELGDVKISHLTAQQINKFLDRKLKSGRIDNKGGLSISYIKTMLIIIQSAISFAVEEGLCMPLKRTIKLPTAEQKDLAILDQNDQIKLENYLIGNVNCTTVGIMLSLYAGLRIGEICALKWEDIDFKKNIICVRHTISRVKNRDEASDQKTVLIMDSPKTASSKRDIPISSLLIPYLLLAKRQTTSDFVVSEGKGFTPPRTFEHRYHKVLKECNIEQINYHALRHTFATRCVEADGEVKSLSEILGHANVATTLNTYVHSSLELKRIQIEKMCVNSSLRVI